VVKIRSEGLGEVQEVVDICEFAVGLSRQLHGLVIASERPGHKLLESWHPLGPTLVISAFNFPMAVWAWNAALALVCGNTVVWKPSEKTPLSALAMHGLLLRAAQSFGIDATGLSKRSILELGGNNAAIVCRSADLSVAVPAIVFAAAGTAGQRCTTTRRLLVQRPIYEQVVNEIKAAYERLAIGNPLDDATRVGPLFEARSHEAMQAALTLATWARVCTAASA
jgi:aldehyde dehydrogenase (NAD+)